MIGAPPAGRLLRAIAAAAILVAALAATARGQDAVGPDERPAFSLSSSEVFTTRDSPHFFLSFRRVSSLDVRVYRVRDAVAFFAGLRDPHQLGTYGEVPVPQERSAIERIADWKRSRRSAIRNFFRGQISREYRAARTAGGDRAQTAQRVQLDVNAFAQVPLLNPSQLVTSWRELLPNHRDTEVRRVPLDVRAPGVYVVEAVEGLLRAYTVVMVSDIGLVTKTAPGQMLMFAADRFSGEPVSGCDVRVLADRAAIATGRSNDDGIYEASLAEERVEQLVGVAGCGGQVVATDPGAYALNRPTRELVGYIYTDKPIYRPGQQVHVKGVLRWREQDALKPFDRLRVELVASDVNDKAVFRQMLDVDAFGSVHATFALPASAALGIYALRIQSDDRQATGAFEVQEYRKPEFEVIVTPASRFVLQGREAVVTVQARYYFGQPVASARLRWVVSQQPYYSPLRWDDGAGEDEPGYFYGTQQTQEGELRLDADGRAELRITLPPDANQRDFSARIEAQVTDSASREVVGRTIVHATWGSFLLSARTDTSVVRAGERVDVAINALDYMGTPQPNLPLTIDLLRLEYPNGYYAAPTSTRVGGAQATTDSGGRASATLALPANLTGSFTITVSADSAGRRVTGDTWVWVPGREDAPDDSDRYLELIADKRTYEPGDTARLVVRGDAIDGPVLVTKEGQHVLWHRLLRPAAGDPIGVPINAADVGDVHVSVTWLRDGRLYRADRRLAVPATDRTLQITVTADQEIARPQQPGVFTVRVVDRQGAPVRAQVSLGVVDEAVYGVKADDTPDPIRFFYRREYTRVSTTFSRNYYFTGYSGDERLQLAGRRRRPFTLADFKGDKPPQPEVRKDFPDAIYWLPDLVTGPDGTARVAVTYPDALTTWRLTARAVTGDTSAGVAVGRTTTTKDLIVRVATPRFLTEGDEVVLPTIVHNYHAEARTAAVGLAVRGLEPAAGAGPADAPAPSALEAGAERRDDWRFAARTPGTATITASAKTETDADAVELPLPVLPYGLRREATASGSIAGTGEATASLTIPESANGAGRSISVALAPSLAGSLLGALDFLTTYPYGCTEQTISSFVPNLLVTRALTELKLAPTERLSALDRMVSSGMQRLLDMQHDDGGWGWWKTDANHPFMTAYALWSLDEARRAGVRVEPFRLFNASRALARMYADYPRAVPDLKAYMAYALQRAAADRPSIEWYVDGGPRRYTHAAVRDELWSARDRMTAYGRALLLLTLDEAKDARGDQLASALESEAITTGELASWASGTDPLLFDSVDTTIEATAFAVQALARRNPSSPVVERAVRYLVLNRTAGYWGTTKQTAMAIYGLLAFMQARGESAQPFSVDVFVNGALAGRRDFTAAALTAPDPIVVTVPAAAGENDVRLVKRSGGGTVYWAAAAHYFDATSAGARTGSRQLAVARAYALLSPVTVNGRIVYRETPFSGRAAPGDVLTVRLTIAGSNDWRYLVLEDPLPAGVEAIQDTSAYPLERERTWWWGSRVEYRDARTVFFQENLEQGRYEYLYLVRVTTAGTFRAVPAQISPMYVPGVFASSDPHTMTVDAGGSGQ